jgi:hypothetical protein
MSKESGPFSGGDMSQLPVTGVDDVMHRRAWNAHASFPIVGPVSGRDFDGASQ